MSIYTRWYRDGSVALTKNSSEVVGTNTYWLTAGLNPGDIFKVDGVDYEILSITDNTHLTLAGNYTGTTGSDKAYAIVRNFTANTQARMAAQTAELLGDFAKYIDNDMQSIHGKNAYQIACDKGFVGTESEWIASLEGATAYEIAVKNGYNGTESEWLESLKAAQEWTAADNRISAIEGVTSELLTSPVMWARNSIYRGKDLGPITDAHYSEISSGRFTDMYIGDYFTIDSAHKYYIGAFGWTGGRNIMLVPAQGITAEEAAPYAQSRSAAAIGTEGEEGYIPAARGEYPDCNWYINLMPKFIAQIEEFFGANHVKKFTIDVPTAHKQWGPMTAWTHFESKAHLPTIGMVDGYQYMYPSCTYPFYMHAKVYRKVEQLPIYRLNQSLRNTVCAEAVDFADSGYIDEYFPHDTNYIVLWENHEHMRNSLKPVFIIG